MGHERAPSATDVVAVGISSTSSSAVVFVAARQRGMGLPRHGSPTRPSVGPPLDADPRDVAEPAALARGELLGRRRRTGAECLYASGHRRGLQRIGIGIELVTSHDVAPTTLVARDAERRRTCFRATSVPGAPIGEYLARRSRVCRAE